MAKNKEVEVPEVEEVEVPKKTDRQAKWEAFVEKYKVANPAKYELKKKELEKIPDSFIG